MATFKMVTAKQQQNLQTPNVQGAYTELDELIAWHRHGNQLALPGRGSKGGALAGRWQTRRRGRGMDFEEVRVYQPGDDIRSIDWRVTARSQQPHTKLFVEERERPVMLVADQRSPMFFGSRQCFKSVYAAHLLSLWAWSVLAQKDRVGGMILGDQAHFELRPRADKRRVLQIIQQLHQFNQQLDSPCPAQSPQALSQYLQNLQPLCAPGTRVVIASDFHDFDDDCRRWLFQLARHNEVILFAINDDLEHHLAELPGNLWVTDGQNHQRLSAQPQAQTVNRACLLNSCNQLGLPLYQMYTQQPLWPRICELFTPSRKQGPAVSQTAASGVL